MKDILFTGPYFFAHKQEVAVEFELLLWRAAILVSCTKEGWASDVASPPAVRSFTLPFPERFFTFPSLNQDGNLRGDFIWILGELGLNWEKERRIEEGIHVNQLVRWLA